MSGRLVGPNGRDPRQAIAGGIDNLMSRIPRGLVAAGLILEGEWKQLLLTPGRGRMYGTHQASAPGDPPAPDTATMQRSITHQPIDESTLRVGTNIKYAAHLEFGTLPRKSQKKPVAGRGRLGSRLGGVAPRPHARPAFTRAEPNMTAALANELRSGNVRSDLGANRGFNG
jgi:phage gpG-like protein